MILFDRHKVFLYQNYLLYAIAFFIPLFPRLVPPLILAFGFLSLFAIFKGFSRVQMGEVPTIMLFLFLIYLLGMIYTENTARGWFNVEVKLSLLAFPLAFFGFKFVNKTNYNRTLKAFLWGTVLAVSFCYLQSAYKVFYLDYAYYHFVTSRFSVIIHQSYFTLYVIFAMIIAIQLNWPIEVKSTWKTIRLVLLLLYFSLAVILTGSKTGFIMWFILAIGMTIVFLVRMRHKSIPIIVLAGVMSLTGIVIQQAPVLQSRLVNVLTVAQSDDVDPTSKESTAVRYLVYSSAWNAITSTPWYGTGTGDFQDVLDAIYTEKGYVQAAEKHLNAHNLFLQTWITIGVHGLMFILGIFILMFYYAMRSKDMVLLGFTLIFFIISLTESTFNVQAGVVFFSFFAVLLTRRNRSVQALPDDGAV
jgi:O-antigen ligase